MRGGDNEERAPAFCRLLQLVSVVNLLLLRCERLHSPLLLAVPQHMSSIFVVVLGGGLMSKTSSKGDRGVESLMIRSKKR